MTKFQQVANTAKIHLAAKRGRGETLTPDESSVIAFIDDLDEWAKNPSNRAYYKIFSNFEAKRCADRSETVIAAYRKNEGCSYREAVLAVSERQPDLVR